MAAEHSVAPDVWQELFEQMMGRIAGRFARVEPRRTARAFVLGLLSDVPRKTCWALAEAAGHARPDAMQRLLRDACWDAEAVRDDLREFVVAHFGHCDGVLIPDETGDLKKGSHTVAVQRQYTGTAGRIENAQVAVYLAYASPRGRALIDRRLYVPRSWTDDPDRCAAAGIPDGVEFATKPQLAGDMVGDALDSGVPAGWVAADEVYGNDPAFRAGMQARGLGYVLAVSCDHRVPIDGGKVRVRADILAAGLPAGSWQRLSAGAGSKGPRWYDWAWLDISIPGRVGHSLLIRRNPQSGELAYYRCWSPRPVPLAVLVRVAGTRWVVEEEFQAGKSQVGLDEHQVRQWTCWQRFTVLAMLALAFLAACAAATGTPPPPGDPYHHARHDDGPIALTVAEIRRLFTILVIRPIRDTAHRLHWSLWRRRHQAAARRSHYKRRLAAELTS